MIIMSDDEDLNPPKGGSAHRTRLVDLRQQRRWRTTNARVRSIVRHQRQYSSSSSAVLLYLHHRCRLLQVYRCVKLQAFY